MSSHYIADEDREGWITCDCGQHYPTREKHDTHRHIERARAALKGGEENDGSQPTTEV